MIKCIVFLFLVHGAISVPFWDEQRGSKVDSSVKLGKMTDIDPSVIIGANTTIGDFVSIERSTSIGENCKVRDHSEINKSCTIENDVFISKFASIGNEANIGNGVQVHRHASVGDGSVIGAESVLAEFSSIGKNTIVGKRVKLHKHASVANGAEVQDDSFMDQFSSIGNNAEISPKVYIGEHASIGSDSIVNESAIVYKFVSIPSDTTIEFNGVVIRSPSTYELYQKCASIESIPEQVQIADDRTTQPSVQFNDMLRGLLDAQINDVKAKCEQGNVMTKPDLSTIKSLYLIQRYGTKCFKETLQKVQQTLNGGKNIMLVNGETYINGFKIESENHFEENAKSNILETEVMKKLVQLLAIDEESERKNRMENETFCSVTTQILNGEREVTVAKSSGQSFDNVNISNKSGGVFFGQIGSKTIIGNTNMRN